MEQVVMEILKKAFTHYNLDEIIQNKDFTSSEYSRVRIKSSRGFSTWNYGELTQLVFLCHDHKVRLDITPVNNMLELWFVKQPEHPGIDEALAAYRLDDPVSTQNTVFKLLKNKGVMTTASVHYPITSDQSLTIVEDPRD